MVSEASATQIMENAVLCIHQVEEESNHRYDNQKVKCDPPKLQFNFKDSGFSLQTYSTEDEIF